MCAFTCAYAPRFARKGPVLFLVFFSSRHGKNHRRKPQGLPQQKKKKTWEAASLKDFTSQKKGKERERKRFNREQHVR